MEKSIGETGSEIMQMKIDRRQFLRTAALTPFLAVAARSTSMADRPASGSGPTRFFFTSQGKTAMMNVDGSGLRYLEFDVPNQATWQPGSFFQMDTG